MVEINKWMWFHHCLMCLKHLQHLPDVCDDILNELPVSDNQDNIPDFSNSLNTSFWHSENNNNSAPINVSENSLGFLQMLNEEPTEILLLQ